MRIAFYAPLKSPRHPVPSGDRQMARLIVRALEKAGHQVSLASELRSFCAEPDAAHYATIRRAAAAERSRIEALWAGHGRPDLFFAYHPYYKSPDWLGPPLAAAAGIPYVTAEASFSARRDVGAWRETQADMAAGLAGAAVNICLTARDRRGLEGLGGLSLATLPPFIDAAPFASAGDAERDPGALIAVAMMRPGDKLDSYRGLAEALSRILDRSWTLTVVGDGPARAAVHAALAVLPGERLRFLGERPPEAMPETMAAAALLTWPGRGEAYGLAYLEAEAAGLPVVAERVAGVPEVVRDGSTGLLAPEGDAAAFAAAVASLLDDPLRCRAMGAAARRVVLADHSLDAAALRLDAILAEAVRR